MNVLAILGRFDEWGPVLFGVGFLAPLIAQSLEAARVSGPGGVPALGIGLVIGTAAGLAAKRRGRWL